MSSYDHKKIESKWQKKWEDDGLYRVEDKVSKKENFYTLVEYPYPSGNLHTGHWYAFAVPDIFARYKRMQGFNVLFPIGFDSFGLPAENAAIKNGEDPKEWTYQNIDTMTAQIKSMGAMFDWSRKVVASDEDYYKWTQWLFLQMYKKGLAYQGEAIVNWDPVDQTVLANEQVLPDGTGERSGALVEKKKLKQWFLKITDYADRLLEDLEDLNWGDQIKQAQREWIGKNEGAEIDFVVKNSDEKIKVFTTRPDTLFGATYMVLAPEHKLVETLKNSIENWNEVEEYVKETQKKSDLDRQKDEREKTGVKLKGIKAINPANNEEIPVYIADYVLSGYGTGAIMAVPAHDERDWEFSQKFGIKTINVIESISESKDIHIQVDDRDESQIAKEVKDIGERKEMVTPTSAVYKISISQEEKLIKIFDKYELIDNDVQSLIGKNLTLEMNPSSVRFFDVFIGDGIHINSGFLNGLDNNDSIKKITHWLEENNVGKKQSIFRLRDWLISRQRYWGTPIPIVYDPEGKAHPVSDEHLPWTLPTDVDFKPTGVAPLARSKELKERVEKVFGKGWTPEVDTMDTFMDSSWYFLRYTDPQNEKEFASKEKLKNWMPVERYSGGAEHTTMHVLYSRFFHKALFDMKLVEEKEPYKERLNRGLILGTDGQKMSKRWGNVIDPDEHVQKVGADVVRMYLGFIGPYNIPGNYPWDIGGVVGIRRFLERVVDACDNTKESTSEEVLTELHRTIKKVGEDIESFKFNTAISQLMILLNTINEGSISKEDMEIVVKLISPFAPHIAEELWEKMGHSTSIHLEEWPKFDESKLVSDTVSIVVQINGKTRGKIESSVGSNEEEILAIVRGNEGLLKWIVGDIKKVIYVENKLINIVL